MQRNIRESIDQIRHFILSQDRGRETIAKEANLGPTTLRNVFSDKWNPRLKTLQSLEKYIQEKEGHS